MTDRRAFIKSTAVAAGALALPELPEPPAAGPSLRPGRQRSSGRRAPLDMLILGGTGFTGPEQVEYAIARGHRVTIINRNRTRPDFFKGRVEQLIGDLDGDMSALRGRKFDVVIDNPTTAPAWVRNAAQYLKGNVGHYIFISTISAYAPGAPAGADETWATLPMPAGLDPYTTDPAARGRAYGPLKAFSEGEVRRSYPDRFTILRPGYIVGPRDRSDRFTYWPYRIDKGGEVLAPGDPDSETAFIDARDIAEWTVRLAEGKTLGAFTVTGRPITTAEMLYGIKAVTTSNAQFTWVPAAFLAEHRVRGNAMPIWSPAPATVAGASHWSLKRALDAGLTYRPLAVTAKDTLDWNKTRPAAELAALAEGRTAGISAQREAELLAAWKARTRDS